MGVCEGEGKDDEPARVVPQIEIWNKSGSADSERRAAIEAMAARRPDVAVISAESGEGVDAARALMAAELTARHEIANIFLRFDQGEAMAWLPARGEVLADPQAEGGHRVTVRLPPPDRAQFHRLWPDAEETATEKGKK